MAGGKLSPRQKMINMMYLVLTALLALNVSREILDAIERLDEGLHKTIMTVDSKNQAIYTAFELAASENPAKAGPWRDKALEVKEQSDYMFNYVESLKKELIDAAGGRNEKEKLVKADNTSIAQNFLVSAHSVKDAYDRIRESLATYLVDFQIPMIAVSPIVEIFPPTEDLDREISRTPIEAFEEETSTPKGKVYSAPGIDEDEIEEEEADSESELEDEFSDED
jgi:hypothetical protein